MVTWRLTSPQEVDRPSQVKDYYFKENEGKEVDETVLWEAYNAKLRGEIKVANVADKRKRNQKCNKLEQQIPTLKAEYEQTPGAEV
ncbi:hypothetical protein NDU88_004726 [Pleurodeles waltl]|uniref:Uncharacterized protein n=1 Tax=Pleurodeles waltl TaxID=8319 RepID=A0AAV7RH16_PLEWA|nr:hypothetical protein NDU88_004726 [Pleurodeles waltl]